MYQPMINPVSTVVKAKIPTTVKTTAKTVMAMASPPLFNKAIANHTS